MTEHVIPTKQMPPGLQVENVDDRIMTLNVGPQHPGSGHMRIIVKIDGDYMLMQILILAMFIVEKKKWLNLETISQTSLI